MKRRRSHIIFYIIWTLVFTLIPLFASRTEKLSFVDILIAFILSAIISIPVTNNFFKVLNRQALKGENVKLDLLPEEKLVLKASASLKRNMISLGGVLSLTDKRILFVGTEFFSRNKKLFSLTLNQIIGCKLINKNRIMIKDNLGQKNTLIVDKAPDFLSELNNFLQ